MRDMMVRVHLAAALPLASFISTVSTSESELDPSSSLEMFLHKHRQQAFRRGSFR